MVVPYLFLVASVVGCWFTYNAYRPVFTPAPLAVASFFAGWLTAELAAHHLLWQVAASAVFVCCGALEAWPGWLALGFTAISWVGLLVLCRNALDARRAIDTALGDALGTDYGEWSTHRLPSDLAHSPEWRQIAFPLPVRHPDVERVRDVTFFQSGSLRLKLDVYRPRHRPARRPALLYVHGGAWIIGSKDQQGLPLMQHLAARGWVCFGTSYRLSPRATFPDHLIDVKRAIAWIREHGASFGADPDFVIIAGGSAGGHLASLAALTANEPAYQPGFEDADTSLSGCVGLYGVYDFVDKDGVHHNNGMKNLLERYVMKAKRATSADAFTRASPIHRVHEAAPPFLLIHGELDTLVPVDEARRFASKLREAGVPVVYAEIPGAQHAFELFPSLRSMRVVQGISRFGGFLHARHVEASARTEVDALSAEIDAPSSKRDALVAG